VIGLSVVIAGSLARPAGAADPLAVIPSDVYGVVALRSPDEVRRKLDGLMGVGASSDSGTDLGVLTDTLDLSRGTVDWSKPLVFVLTQPYLDFLTADEFSESSAVVAFSPKLDGWYESLGGEQQAGGIKRVRLNGRQYYAIERDGVVLLGGRRKAMRMLRGEVAASESLAASLDEEQRTVYAQSDLFVHLPMRGWRERISLLSTLAANMVRLGMATEHDARMSKVGSSVIDWAMSGFGRIVEQMESVSFGVSLDGDTFRLTHYHRFTPGGSVAEYLGHVTRSQADLWAVLPDRPFYLLGVFDWQTPPDLSVTVRFNQYLYDSEFMGAGSSPELRKELRDKTIACYDQMTGGCLMVTSPEETLLPVQILGGYGMKDARQGIEQLRFIQEHAEESFSGFLGVGFAGPFEQRTIDGHDFFELRFDAEKVHPRARRQMQALYGADLRIQDGLVEPHYVMYSLSTPPGLVPEAIRAKTGGNNIGKNSRVQEIRSRLPQKPHGLVILDVGRFLSAAPMLIQASMSGTELGLPASTTTAPENKPTTRAAGAQVGPLLGWACVAHPTALSGHLAISVKDASEVAKLSQQMVRDLPRAMASPGGIEWKTQEAN
jgi:hypothetical protein